MARLPDKPTVSVIICSYNRPAGLRRAIASVQAQTYPVHELIVVDDGSTDPAYALPPPAGVVWLRAVPHSRERCGYPCLGYVKNLGIARATGDLLAFLDDDDEWYPPKLERQVAAMRTTGCGLASAEARRGQGPSDPRRQDPLYLAEWARRPAPMPARLTRAELENENPLIHSSVVVERSLVLAAGGYDELPLGGVRRDGRLLVEDWELWKRCLQATDCVFVSEPLLYYDGRSSGKTERRFLAGAVRWLTRLRQTLV
jgi:glycosyltransferase involved in cell wall biosynthesis